MGGTFDPVHIGHLMLAEQAAGSFNLTKILFMPAGRPPHKDAAKISSVEHRVGMLRLATGPNALFETSVVECERPGVNYTFETLDALRRVYGPEAELFYIIGSDVLKYIDKFIRYERVLSSCVLLASTRPGADRVNAGALAASLTESYGARIELINFPEIDISSSLIRRRIADGQSVRYMTPDGVIAYIAQNGLYTTAEDTELPGYWDSIPAPRAGEPAARRDTRERLVNGSAPAAQPACGQRFMSAGSMRELRHIVASRQGAGRFEHTLRVMETADGLAAELGADREKTRLAALLHDLLRDAPAGKLIGACESGGLAVGELERAAPIILHAPAGAIEAEKLLNRLCDPGRGGTPGPFAEILEAIASHTTGRANMGLIAKIIFIADAVEPGRDYKSSAKARAELRARGGGPVDNKRLDAVMLYLLDNQIEYTLSKGGALHPDTVHARNWLVLTNKQ